MTTKEANGALFSRALFNQYNLLLLGGAGLFTLTTGSWLPAMLGGGAELLWLILGSDSESFRRWVERQEAEEAQAALTQKKRALLQTLSQGAQSRVTNLEESLRRLQHELAQNSGALASLLTRELPALERLSFSFLELSAARERLERYLTERPRDPLWREVQRLERLATREVQPEVRENLHLQLNLAQKNLSQYDKLIQSERVLAAKLDSIEASLSYLRTQVMSAGDPKSIGRELRDLLLSVESDQEAAQEVTDW